MLELTKIQIFIIWALPTLFAITLHEVAHGWMALRLGDRTAQMLGRLTINPIKHIDPLGTVILPTLLFFIGGFVFGWAKPVPVTWANLKKPRRDMALVALAGPIANILMAFFWAILWKISFYVFGEAHRVGQIMALFGQVGIIINLVFAVLNLLPIPPLDGSRLVSSLLPPKLSWKFNQLEQWSFFILIFLLATGLLNKVVSPAAILLSDLITRIFQLPS